MSSPMSLEGRATRLAELLSERGVTVPLHVLKQDIRLRRDALADQLKVTPATALRYLDDGTLALAADHMVAQIADERPGEDPWSRPPTIPIPIPVAAQASWGLQIAARAAAEAGDAHVTTTLIGASFGLCRFIAQSPWPGNTDGQPVTGVVVVPREGLAWASRMLKSAAGSFRDGSLDPEDGVDPQGLAGQMEADANLLRMLIDRFAAL